MTSTLARTLILLVGLPRSGKSTWARQQSFPIVSPDEIRLALHGQVFVAEAEPFVWSIAQVMVKALFGAGHPIVILDATNISEERQKVWKDRQWECRFKLFKANAATCKERAILDGRSDLLPIIDRMASNQHWPETLLWKDFQTLDDVIGQDEP